jgi:hypothetical protein
MRAPRPALLAALTLALSASPALGAAASAEVPGDTSLEGYFLLRGRITSAVHVPGEHAGQALRRSWAFIPLCRVGACAEVRLVRRGSRGRAIVLHRLAPALYEGGGTFSARLRCGRRVFRNGETVLFSITVRILAAAPAGVDGTGARRIVATAIRATYNNPLRINQTPCVAIPSREAATYRRHRPTLR